MDEQKQEHSKQLHKGILCIISAAFFFALMNLFVSLSGDVPTIQKTFFRNLFAMFIASGVMIKNRCSIIPPKGARLDLFLRSAFGYLGVVCNFFAISRLNISDASLLNKMSPFFAILFSLFLLKERANIWQYLSVLAAFGGAMLIIKPGFSADAFPAVIGLLGGMGAGAAYTFVRALSKRKEKSARIVFFFSAFSTLTALPFVIADFHPMTFAQFMCLMGAGAAATLGQFGVTLAYLHAPAKEISVFDYTQVLFSAALGFFMFGQIPDGLSVLGYIVICGVSVAMFCYNRHLDAGEHA